MSQVVDDPRGAQGHLVRYKRYVEEAHEVLDKAGVDSPQGFLDFRIQQLVSERDQLRRVLRKVVDRFWEPSEDNDALLAEVEAALGDK